MRAKKTYIFLIAFFALFSGNAFADFYTYTDGEGVVHITNVPSSSKYKWMMGEKKIPRRSVNNNNKRFDDIIADTSARYGVDPKLVRAVVKAESDFDTHAVSRKGAQGLMQLMPETARLMGVRDAHDPEENIEGGIKKLSALLRMFDWNLHLALAAYNAGESSVQKYGGVPPYSETKNYVKKVLYYYNLYKGAEK